MPARTTPIQRPIESSAIESPAFLVTTAANDRPVIGLSERTDEELACRAQAGSLPSFAELVRRWESRLFNFVLRRTSGLVLSHADAEDITQDAFVRAWQRIGDYRPGPRRRFSTWLFTIASRLAVDHARERGVAQRHQHAVALRRNHLAEGPDPFNSSAEIQDGAQLWTLASQTLSDDQHAAMWLRYAEDLTMAEIARVLGRTQIGVRVMLHRARATLLQTARDHAHLFDGGGVST